MPISGEPGNGESLAEQILEHVTRKGTDYGKMKSSNKHGAQEGYEKVILICVLIAGVLVSAGCSGSRVKAPERVFEPEEAFLEIPHSSFEAEWLEGGMKDEDGHVYEEVYDLFWPWTGR